MSTEDQNRLEQQRRRARIDRMKVMIVRGIAFWILFSLIAIIVLIWQTVSLRMELNQLRQQITETVSSQGVVSSDTQKTQQDPDKKTGTDTQSDIEPEQSTEPKVDSKTSGEAIQQQSTDESLSIDMPENMASEGDVHKVYLTFDGTPGKHTEKILSELKKQNIKATFFVAGSKDKESEAVYREIVADGHTLGMNSYSNQYSKIYQSKEAFTSDLKKISDYLYKITGLRCSYYRFPGGSGNGVSNVDMKELVKVLNEQNITYFDWNVAAQDTASDSTVEDVVTSVTEGVANYKTSIVLLHDGGDKSTTADAIGPLISALKEMNAEILPIDEDTDVIQYIKADSVN